jgi:hypothetical protein
LRYPGGGRGEFIDEEPSYVAVETGPESDRVFQSFRIAKDGLVR